MPANMDILNWLPEVAALGRVRLEELCNEWLQRPIARQHSVTHLIVGSDLMLTVNIDDARATFTDDHAFIPIDELLGYIVDQQFSAIDRATLHAKLRELRNQFGETGYRFEAMAGRVGKLWLKCKNPACDVSMETAQEAVEGQVIECPATSVTCPVCGHVDSYDGGDLHLRLG